MTDGDTRTLAILVGGGPAPGLNGVINSVTLAARARGWRVLGVPEGFKHLMKGDTSPVRELTEKDVEGIEQRGGSILFTSRANPQKDPEAMQRVADSLKKLGVTDLVTLGGDDTATSATKVSEALGGNIRVAHMPKTIDNDLPLPGLTPTFGYETARHKGMQIVQDLREDAKTTRRWYLVTAMGRSSGSLALGIGTSAGAHLTLIREEMPEKIGLDDLAALVEAAILKRLAQGEPWGVAVLAEGLLYLVRDEDMAALPNLERDEHGHPRLSEVDLGNVVKGRVAERLAERGIPMKFITKILGYELRCADPVGFDVQYTRTLGAGAVEFLANGEGSALVSLQDGAIVPIRFPDLRDPETGKVRVRRVDPESDLYKNAVRLQARITERDLEGERLKRLADAAKLEPDAFKERFGKLARS